MGVRPIYCPRCKSNPCCCLTAYSSVFGNFFRNGSVTLAPNEPMAWTNTGASSGGVFLASPTDIEVTQAGFYYVHYTVQPILKPTNLNAIVGIFINGTEVPNHQTRNGVSISEESASINITWGTIIFIPAGALIQLRALFFELELSEAPVIPSAAINLIKLS